MRRAFVLVSVVLVTLTQIPAMAWAADGDGDLIDDTIDVCPAVADPYQGDHDADGIGDLCDPDIATTATPGDDLLIGGDLADSLDGLEGDDHLYGQAGDDTLDGGDGDDFLDGGPGADTSTGGAGCDVFSLDPRSMDADTISDYTPGEDRFTISPTDDDPSDDTLDYQTTTTPDGLRLAFTFDGQPTFTLTLTGLTTLPDIDTTPCTPPPCANLLQADANPFLGSPSDDTIYGTGADDSIFGAEGDDCLYGLEGTDLLSGDVQDPTMTLFFWWIVVQLGGNPPPIFGNDLIDGGDGSDVAYGDFVEFVGATLLLTPGNDVLVGGPGIDVLMGDGATWKEAASGRLGDDRLYGGTADDTLYGDLSFLQFDDLAPYSVDDVVGGDDQLRGGDGGDFLVGDFSSVADLEAKSSAVGGSDLLYGDAGNDSIHGDFVQCDTNQTEEACVGGNDTLYGGSDSDKLYGDIKSGDLARGGNDLLYGESGDDTLYGDANSCAGTVVTAGHDLLDGGSGNDTIYGDTKCAGLIYAGDDTITGGVGNDNLYGETAGAPPTAEGGNDTFIFAITTGFGDDVIWDAGSGWSAEDGADTDVAVGDGDIGVDTLRFEGVASIGDLDARSTVVDGGPDVTATVFTDITKTTPTGSILIKGIGTVGDGDITSFAEIDGLAILEVTTTP